MGLAILHALFLRCREMSNPVVDELINLLQLERLEDNLFRGQSRDIGTRYVFGGQVLGQALSAAQQTVDPARHAHLLHAYFLRAGDVEAPIVYNVERSRDGHSFSARRVVAIQHGQTILNMTASFHVPESGAEHQFPMPLVPKPEDLPDVAMVTAAELEKVPAQRKRWLNKDGPFQFRHVHPRNELNLDPPAAVPECLVPPHRPRRRQSGAASLPAGLRIGLPPDRHHHISACVFYLQPNVRMASLDHACGSIARFAPTNGCCMPVKVPVHRLHAVLRVA